MAKMRAGQLQMSTRAQDILNAWTAASLTRQHAAQERLINYYPSGAWIEFPDD